MSKWKVYRLDEVADILNHKRIPLNTQERAKRKGIYQYYGASGVVDHIDGYLFEGEHVLISEDGENLRTRNTPIAFKASGKFWVNNHAHIVKGKEPFLNDWIVYFFQNTDINPFITGAVQPKLNKENLLSIPIRLPDLKTAQSITEILSSLDDKIEVNNQINQELEALAQALFKQWFIDFEFPDEDGQPYKSSGGDMVESELGEIPKGWKIQRLKELLTIKRGGSPRPIQDYMVPKGLPWVKISDATAINTPFLFSTKEFIKQEGLKKTVYLKKGSLILSNSATPGLPKFLELDACIHDGWLHFQDIKTVSYTFLYLLFISIRENLVGRGNGSIFINLKTDILKDYAISVAHESILDRFNQAVDSIFDKIREVASENLELEKLKNVLLPKLFSGELTLSEALNKKTV